MKKAFTYVILFVCICCTTLTLFAQKYPVEKMTFHALTINDGLSQGMVNQILQDRYGFMWFATKDGLNRYDGYHFKIYRHDTEDTSSIAGSFVQSLFEDSKGRIWTGTSSGNVDYFDHASGKFRHIISDKNGMTDIVNGPVRQISEDKQGNIWILSYKRLIRVTLSEKTEAYPVLIKRIELPASADTEIFNGLSEADLFISSNSDIYLYNIYTNVFYLFQFPNDKWERHILPTDGNKDKKTLQYGYHILEDKSRQIIYTTCPAGIYKLKDGIVTEQILNYPLFPAKKAFTDKEGNIWLSQTTGLGVYHIKTGKFSFIVPEDETTQTLLGLLNSASADQSGMIWIGTTGYGLLTLNSEAFNFHHTERASVFSFSERDDGRILINCGGDELKVLDLSLGSYIDTLPLKDAKTYYEKELKSRRWYVQENVLYYNNPTTGERKNYPLPLKLSEGNYGSVSDIKEDVNGKVWLGTITDGLLCFDRVSNKWTSFKNDPKDKNSLSFNSIFTLCFDPAEPTKYLWVGTNGGGLNRMSLSTNQFIRYSVKNGLPNDVVYGILPDNSNNLWMSTNKGLSCFTPSKQSFKNYEEKDGLQSNEFNHGVYLRTKKGILLFGGVNGYNYFDPAAITSNPVAPKIVITDLRIKNQIVNVNEPGSPLKNAVYLEKKIVLPYSDNMITFEFAAMDFAAPDKNQYKFRLVGFDGDWINAGNNNTTTYTNLDPGTYTFKVKGSNKDEVWNEEGVSIQLVITPPWYKTWWFRVLIGLAIIGIIYFVYKYRLKQALKLHAIRNSIARDLHDEIGSNLSNISIFSEVAQQQNGTAAETEPILKKINEYARVSMTSMSDIVWMINARNDSFENIITRMRSLAAEIFEAKNYTLHLNFDERLNELSLNMEQRKNFYLIYKEAINNVAKYASCKNVWISLQKDGNNIRLEVKDDGVGFSVNTHHKGNGLYNMEKRAETLNGKLKIESKKDDGTTVELIFNC